MNDYSKKIAMAALEISAIEINFEDPIRFTSGLLSPIYFDNRRFLFKDEYRMLIFRGLYEAVRDLSFDVVAGVATGGIPWGTLLADKLGKPFVYIRDKPKPHGLRKAVEGARDEELNGKNILLVEDLIATGKSSISNVNVLRSVEANCDYCLSIFDYNIEESNNLFSSLDPVCEKHSLLDGPQLFRMLRENGHINDRQLEVLKEWRRNPHGWSAEYGK